MGGLVPLLLIGVICPGRPPSPEASGHARGRGRGIATRLLHVGRPRLQILRAAQPDPDRSARRPRDRASASAAIVTLRGAAGSAGRRRRRPDRRRRRRPRGGGRAPATRERFVPAQHRESSRRFRALPRQRRTGRDRGLRPRPAAADGAAAGLQPGRREDPRQDVDPDTDRRRRGLALPGRGPSRSGRRSSPTTATCSRIWPGSRPTGGFSRAHGPGRARAARPRNARRDVIGGVSVAAVWEPTRGTAWVNPNRRCTSWSSVGRRALAAWVSVVMWTTVPVRRRERGRCTRGAPAGGPARLRTRLGRATDPRERASRSHSRRSQHRSRAEPYSDPLPPARRAAGQHGGVDDALLGRTLSGPFPRC